MAKLYSRDKYYYLPTFISTAVKTNALSAKVKDVPRSKEVMLNSLLFFLDKAYSKSVRFDKRIYLSSDMNYFVM